MPVEYDCPDGDCTCTTDPPTIAAMSMPAGEPLLPLPLPLSLPPLALCRVNVVALDSELPLPLRWCALPLPSQALPNTRTSAARGGTCSCKFIRGAGDSSGPLCRTPPELPTTAVSTAVPTTGVPNAPPVGDTADDNRVSAVSLGDAAAAAARCRPCDGDIKAAGDRKDVGAVATPAFPRMRNGESEPVAAAGAMARAAADDGDARYVATDRPPADVCKGPLPPGVPLPAVLLNIMGRPRAVISSGVGGGDNTLDADGAAAVSARRLAMYGCFNNRPTDGRSSGSAVRHCAINSDSAAEYCDGR